MCWGGFFVVFAEASFVGPEPTPVEALASGGTVVEIVFGPVKGSPPPSLPQLRAEAGPSFSDCQEAVGEKAKVNNAKLQNLCGASLDDGRFYKRGASGRRL
jgi:hypothetical protein